jgi:hypothetical protein
VIFWLKIKIELETKEQKLQKDHKGEIW